jgi:hypothetical protein
VEQDEFSHLASILFAPPASSSAISNALSMPSVLQTGKRQEEIRFSLNYAFLASHKQAKPPVEHHKAWFYAI